jgi:hypothetical protein
VIAWRDVLHEGPVPEGLSHAELREARARFIAESDWAPYDETLRWLADRDRAVEAAEHLVLWFEHDLYDQLQLLQVLALALEVGGTVELVQQNRNLGEIDSGHVSQLLGGRRPVTEAQRELARSAWAGFRSRDPMDVQAIADGDTSALPFLGPALHRHLQQFPARRNGLARTERLIVEAVATGASTRPVVFEAVQAREEAPFMGDVVFWTYLDRLEPLVGRDGDLRLTAIGEAVLAGDEDWIELNGIARWLGGVHLSGQRIPWRWDEARRRVVTLD